jgi:hypothetical protein
LIATHVGSEVPQILEWQGHLAGLHTQAWFQRSAAVLWCEGLKAVPNFQVNRLYQIAGASRDAVGASRVDEHSA